MLLLVTILLVLVAAVTLLIGIFSDNLALIFLSIGASALAAIVLAVLSQVSKRKGREATAATGAEPLPAQQPADVGQQAAADIATIGEPVSVAADAPTTSMPAVGGGALPIANYDSLRVNEILPALDDLDLDQLETVAQHEESHKNRTTVLNRIDDRMDELEAQEAGGAPEVVDLTDEDEEVEAELDDEDDVAAAAVEAIATVGEPVVTPAASSSPASDGFPIADYDDLDEDELIERLEELDADQLEAVADREEAGQNRDAVLDAIDDRLDILEGIVPAPPAKAPAATRTAAKAPAKKAPTATKMPVRKAPAKAAPSKKVTAPTTTRKVASPTPVKKTAAKASTSAAAKKVAAPAKKTATKAAAAKAPAKKAAAPAARATKKAATTTKKAAPVKKAAAAKKTSKR